MLTMSKQVFKFLSPILNLSIPQILVYLYSAMIDWNAVMIDTQKLRIRASVTVL